MGNSHRSGTFLEGSKERSLRTVSDASKIDIFITGKLKINLVKKLKSRGNGYPEYMSKILQVTHNFVTVLLLTNVRPKKLLCIKPLQTDL